MPFVMLSLAVTSAVPGFCSIGSSGVPGRAVSESGRLRRGADGHAGGDRRRSVLRLPTLLERVK